MTSNPCLWRHHGAATLRATFRPSSTRRMWMCYCCQRTLPAMASTWPRRTTSSSSTLVWIGPMNCRPLAECIELGRGSKWLLFVWTALVDNCLTDNLSFAGKHTSTSSSSSRALRKPSRTQFPRFLPIRMEAPPLSPTVNLTTWQLMSLCDFSLVRSTVLSYCFIFHHELSIGDVGFYYRNLLIIIIF